MSKLELEVGKTYVNLNEEDVLLIDKFVSANGDSIFLGENKEFYYSEGYSDNTPSLYKEKIEKYLYLDDDNSIRTKLVGNTIELIRSHEVSASLTNTGNGYIAKFNSSCSSAQDYYVCLSYSQAKEMLLLLMHVNEDYFREI